MTSLNVGALVFDFQPPNQAQIYDTWAHYAQLCGANPGLKAVDIVAVEGAPPAVNWLIEAKDFRIITDPPKPSNLTGLPATVVAKANATLAGLADAAINAVDRSERVHANSALNAHATRVVLHLEPHAGPHSALFPAAFAANVLQQLRIIARHIDTNPLVLSIATTPSAGVPWTVT